MAAVKTPAMTIPPAIPSEIPPAPSSEPAAAMTGAMPTAMHPRKGTPWRGDGSCGGKLGRAGVAIESRWGAMLTRSAGLGPRAKLERLRVLATGASIGIGGYRSHC
jgi:hypothetical protein